MEEQVFNLSKSREVVKQILQGVYTGSENHRIIELIFKNVETQDTEFIRLENHILEEIRRDKRPLTKEGVLTLFEIRRNKLLGNKLK